jgi:predicted phosphodiesterase
VLLGLLSDPHANLFALEAVLQDVDSVCPDLLICLGDFIGYGAQPNEVVRVLKDRCDISLAGNHDLAVLGSRLAPRMNEMATAAADWTREQLEEDTRSFLERLPSQGNIDSISIAHGSLRDPVAEYVLDVGTASANFDEHDFNVAVVGHTHVPAAFWMETESVKVRAGRLAVSADRNEVAFSFDSVGRLLLNPGSIGQPRDGDPRAAWATWEPEKRVMTMRRVQYPIAYEQEAIRKAGLPEPLAARLASGM